MFTNWKQNPQQMIRNKIMGGDVGSGVEVGGGQPMAQSPMMQTSPMPGVSTGSPMRPMPQAMPQSMPGNMMAQEYPMQTGNPLSNMMGQPIALPGQNPVMRPRQIMPGNFAGTNGSGLMGYRPGR